VIRHERGGNQRPADPSNSTCSAIDQGRLSRLPRIDEEERSLEIAGNGPGGAGVKSHNGRLVFISDEGPGYADAAIEFRQLHYFVSVAEELHFGRAAERLFITQPALSQAIAGLERALGARLLERSRQSVELTEAGAELLQRARGMLVDRDEAVDGVRRIARGEAGVLRAGVALLADHEVGGVLASFAARDREIVLDRFAAVSERLLASVQDHGLHVALVHQVPVLATLEGVDWEVLRQASLAALIGESSPLAARNSVALSELSRETFFVNPRRLAPSAFEGLSTMCRTYGGFEPRVLESSTWALGHDWQTIVDGDAVALMADGAARALQPPGTAVVRVQEPTVTLAIAWRRGDRSSILARFLEFARAYRDAQGWAEDAPSARV
jgi:LysR family transcriptional regulator, benzoate and cis,cis-muconate-responsive activator of ben and cat genes